MQVYIALLRGINVSGSKKLPMIELRAVLSNLNLSQVQTYIQSGNILFTAPKQDQKKLARQISNAIKQQYNYEVPVLVKTIKEWKNAMENNPYAKKDISKQCITFLDQLPEKTTIEIDSKDDEFTILGTEIYLYCPSGFGRTKLSNNFFERKLKVAATSRNWKTINKLLALAEEIIPAETGI